MSTVQLSLGQTPARGPAGDPAENPGGSPQVSRRPALSPSRAGDFKQCPLLYRFRAVDRLPEVSTRAQVRGTVVHAALESLYGLPAAQRIRGAALELVESSWTRLLADSPELAELVGANAPEAFLDEARALVDTYYELEDPTAFEPESCEQRVEIELPDGVPLRGFIDRIDVASGGQLRVVDYKTGRCPSEMMEPKALFQMKFYALMLLRLRGVLPAQLKLIYLADGKVLTYAPDEAELARFGKTLSALWQAILSASETGNFQPTPGKMCKWCDHQARCPAFGGTPPPYPGWPG